MVANSFAAQVVPPGLYTTLKLGLLLSLVQCGVTDREKHTCLDVLALTSDTLIVDRFCPYFLTFSDR